MTERNEIKFEIVERIGVLTSYPTGWNKEFNVVKWNEGQEKYDIRDWAPDHERMSKGITLFSGEMKKIVELCNGRFDEMSQSDPVKDSTEGSASVPATEPVQAAANENAVAADAPF